MSAVYRDASGAAESTVLAHAERVVSAAGRISAVYIPRVASKELLLLLLLLSSEQRVSRERSRVSG